jgi:transposase
MVVLHIDPAVQAIIDELLRRIAQLEKTVAEQARRIEEQDRIIEEWKRGIRARPRRGKKKKSGGAKKKPGRESGHEPAQRPMPDHVDREVPREKETCDNGCPNGSLEATGRTDDVVVEHLIPARVEVERNTLFEYACSCCGEVQWSALPPEYGPAPPPGQPMLGPSVLSTALRLRFDLGLSWYKVARSFGYAGLPISASGVYQMVERAAAVTRPAAEEILERATMSAFLNVDETTHWEDGARLWAWIFANRDLSYFHIDKSRGHGVIEKILCELDADGRVSAPYEGVVVSDFMGAYATCEWMVHQWCWVHLLRDAKKEAELDPGPRTEAFCDRLHGVYRDALAAQKSQSEDAKRDVRARLDLLVADAALGEHSGVARLQGRAFTEFHGLLHFLDDPDIPPHNNGGEGDIRPLVLFRKTSFGTRSERGTLVHAHFLSLAQTAKKQGVDLGDFVTRCMTAHRAGAPPPSIFAT